MITANISDFRKDMKHYLDSVSEDFETVIINRGKNSGGVVVISLDEYNSMLATNHELSSEANRKRLDESLKQLSEGKGFQKELVEV